MKRTAQFIRTDKAIMQALIALLKEKPFEKITIQDILDETPVTRTTFYAHFKDKYEIAERMQEEYLRMQKHMQEIMGQKKKVDYPVIIHSALLRNREMMEALLKIHTDRVDLRGVLARELEEEYLRSFTGVTCHTEATVYAQAMTAFQLSYLQENDGVQFSLEYVDQVMIEVFLNILRLNNRETKEYLFRKLEENQNT